MKAAFGGVTKMLTGKNFPQNTRALRIVVEQILHQILCVVNTLDELMQKLKARASKSTTAKDGTCVLSRAIESSQQSCGYWENTNTY